MTLVGILALAIGANVGVLSVAHHVMFAPLPYADPGRLVDLWGESDGRRSRLSEADYLFLRDESHSLESISFFQDWASTLTHGSESTAHRVAVISPGLFATLGVRPVAGRFPAPGDPAIDRGVVISHELWTTRFAGDDRIIGESIVLDRERREVIGVAPPGFGFPARSTAVWIPREPSASAVGGDKRVVARLAQDASMRSLRAELEILGGRLTVAAGHDPNRRIRAVAMQDEAAAEIRPTVLLLWMAVSLILVLAGANLAQVVLARAVRAEPEVWTRMALGARRAQALRPLFLEVLLLLLAGGVASLLVAHWLLLATARIGDPRIRELSIAVTNPFLLGLAALTSVTLAIAYGYLLARGASGVASGRRLHRMGPPGPPEASSLRWIRVARRLAVFQVAVSVGLLIAAAATLRALWHHSNVDLGFDPAGVTAMWVQLDDGVYDRDIRILAFQTGLLDRLQRHAAPLFAGISHNGLFVGTMTAKLSAVPAETGEAGRGIEVELRPVSAGYFQAMGIPLVRGRAFDDAADDPGGARQAVVDARLARQLWGDGDPLGRRVDVAGWVDGGDLEIVGVARPTRDMAVGTAPSPTLYVPYTLVPSASTMLLVRTGGDPRELVGVIRHEIRALDEYLAPVGITTVEQMIAGELAPARLRAFLLAAFGTLSVLVAALGAYGLLTYLTTQRAREFGIRMALGADGSDIRSLVVRHAAGIAALGVAVGLALGHLLTAGIAAVVPDASAVHWSDYALAALVLASTVLIASHGPARRAEAQDPAAVMRAL